MVGLPRAAPPRSPEVACAYPMGGRRPDVPGKRGQGHRLPSEPGAGLVLYGFRSSAPGPGDGVFLELFNANEATPFVQWVFRATDQIMQLFCGIFPAVEGESGSLLDPALLFAMFMYWLLAVGGCTPWSVGSIGGRGGSVPGAVGNSSRVDDRTGNGTNGRAAGDLGPTGSSRRRPRRSAWFCSPSPAGDRGDEGHATISHRSGPGWIASATARLARIGADPRDDEDLRQKKSLLVPIVVLILPVSLVWGILYIGFGSWAGITAFIYFAVSLGSLVVFARTGNFRLLLVTQLLDIILSPTAGQMFVGGFLPSGGVALWGILAPLGALVFLEVRRAIRWFVAFVLVFLLTGIAGEVFFPNADFPAWFPSTMLALNIVGAGAISFTRSPPSRSSAMRRSGRSASSRRDPSRSSGTSCRARSRTA